MADAIISQVVDRVTAIIQDQISNEVNLGRGREMELLDLSNKLNTIRNVLDVAEMRGVNDQRTKNWLKKLQGTSYDIDNILDEWEYSLPRHNMEAEQKVGCSSITSSCFNLKKFSVRHNAAKTIENVKAKLASLLNEMDQFEFVRMLNGGLANSQPATDISRQKQATSSIDFRIYVGSAIDKKKDDIVTKLMLNGGNIQILSIVGVGGVGKTTLARLIYNDTQFVKDNFDLRIWICVSHPFDVVRVAREIVEYVGKERIPPNNNQSDLILKKLKASVEKRKFLLVLDDAMIEDREKWELIYMYLQYGAPDSKILVTTTDKSAAKMMDSLDDDIYSICPLSPAMFWSLLRDISLPTMNEEACGEFKGVGMKLARKCEGLALAAIVLGRLLQFKDLEGWRDVEKSEIWKLENEEVKPFSYLDLSYCELSSSHKLCFSYCAIYPKNFRFHVESLIEEWVALGYLSSVSGNDGVELGRKCFKKLAMLSLFQDLEKIGEQIEWCKMHDLVRDFALICRKNNKMSNTRCQVCDPRLVSQVQDGLYWDKESPLVCCDCLKSVSVLRTENGSPPARMEKLINLRWLDFRWTTLSNHGLRIICMLSLLQTLSLTRCNLIVIPQEIGNLVELRRLDLSWNEELKELPESMYNLVKLQTLSIAYCSLKEIREEIGKLIELTRLDLSWNRELKQLPESMYKLAKLQSLSLACCSVGEIPREIKNLVQLRNLDLSGNVLLKELPESMRHLVELRTLSLACCSLKEIGGEIGDLIRLTQLDLRWNRELKELPESISRLVELQILNIKGTKVHHRLPVAVGQLSNLLRLELTEFKAGSQYNKLGLLNKVKHSTVSLTLDIYYSSMSEMVELAEDAREAQLKILLQDLKILKISFEGTMNGNEASSSSTTPSSTWMKLLESLEPHHKLKQLTIWRYEGSMLPSWMASPRNLIKEISLHCLSEVSSLPALGKLPLLEALCIDNLKELKRVGREFLGIESASHDDIVVAFPKLKELTFDTCPKWEEWEDITEEEEEFAAISIMPCLTVLSINYCKTLKELPHRLLHKAASSFKLLDTEGSTELAKTYRSGGSHWKSISKNNTQLCCRWY